MADDIPSASNKDPKPKGEARDLLAEAKEAFSLAVDAEADNRKEAEDDIRFARLGEQWPEEIARQRRLDGKPMLTPNRLPAFIRQVVNDARQNKPTIKVHPADSGADIETADVMNGLIRNIEQTSDAEVAYDTATESAVSMGWGYFAVDLDYAYDDSFDLDLKIRRIADPFSVYGDPWSKAADSSDWNTAFETEWLTLEQFQRDYPKAGDPGDWPSDKGREHWFKGKDILLARWWQREEVDRKVYLLSDGTVMDADELDEMVEIAPGQTVPARALLELQGVTVKRERTTKSHKVKRHVLTGGKVLESEDWPGSYIPIIPVYGDEVVDANGKRHFRSLIRDAKSSQQMFNIWRTTAVELVALAPRVPFIGPKGAFKSDARNWATANTVSHPYLEYDVDPKFPGLMPQRQPLDTGAAAGALQEALNASDDMKAIIGLQEASLGQQGNERSGRAILARQREGDVSTFHFQDNMSRAIRHAGRILIDLIPKVYNAERIIRVMGEDGTAKTVPLKQPVPVIGEGGQPQKDPDGAPMMRVFDLAAGKYDLTVTTGPSYTTRREEAREQIATVIQAAPQLMGIAGDLLVKSMDWEGADEMAERMKKMLPAPLNGGPPPEIAAQMQQMQQMLGMMKGQNDQLMAYVRQLEGDRTIDGEKVQVAKFDAETKRLAALGKIQADGTNVTDAPGPNGDWDGLVAAAEADKLYATADKERSAAELNRARAIRELTDPGTPPAPPAGPGQAQRPPALPQRMQR